MDKNIINFNEVAFDNEACILIKHGPLTMKKVSELSDFVRDLNLDSLDNEKLVLLMTDLLLAAERDQYVSGLVDGISLRSEEKWVL